MGSSLFISKRGESVSVIYGVKEVQTVRLWDDPFCKKFMYHVIGLDGALAGFISVECDWELK